MINFTICDDIKDYRQDLVSHIERWCQEKGETFRIHEFSSGEELLEGFPHDTDILLLDIVMGRANGIETAKLLRETAPDLCIIFITNMPEYSLQSYEVHPFGFLLKPILYFNFEKEMDMVRKFLRRKDTHTMFLKSRRDGHLYQVETNDILFFEVQNHDIYAVTEKNGECIFRDTIANVEKNLEGYGFFRCHQGFLVNYRHIKEIGDDVILTSGQHLPISRQRRKQFLFSLTKYVGAAPL